MHIHPLSVPHCRVLPPGEFRGVIREPLPVCSESFMITAVTIFHNKNLTL